MKKILLASALALTAFAGAASAEGVVVKSATEDAQVETFKIGAGKKGGGYDGAARGIASQLNSFGTPTEVVNMNGSDALSLALCSEQLDAAPFQLDAEFLRGEQCAFDDRMLYGGEYVMLFVPEDSKKNELHDFGEGDTFFTGPEGSGAWVSLKAMQIIDREHGQSNEWTKVQPAAFDDYRTFKRAIRKGADAVLVTNKANADIVIALVDAGYELADLKDRDLNDAVSSVTGKSVYKREKIKIKTPSGNKAKGYALKVESFFFTNAGDDEANEKLDIAY